MKRRTAALAAALAACSAPAAAQLREVYVNAADYPAGVTPDTRIYRVQIRYELSEDGRIARCAVTERSHEPLIDAETCRIMQSRARIRAEPGRRQGLLQFIWGNAETLRAEVVRGEPIAYSVAQVISTDDYPRDAIRAREQGTVAYEIAVSSNGVPMGCRVTQSSGSETLDRYTCEILMERSTFIPAADGYGTIGGLAHGRITWRLPG